ncbi:hypothetical protein HMPREF0063_10815 [Aeromicrobium marinum DSM 15272]|uniref:AB hydrolase-1 domain-containing protein n=1 Tax=Aeromicrobium marinum DSM 15272 TaxID=585531 RepID=E2SA25_9ACTN|nr:alpha/beta hydrolase [Aeromicrobium marinum]EFQ84099.1 hypothetical protein HMPREF0063_10815 [Aeromicrobium marinum DSM 15272]
MRRTIAAVATAMALVAAPVQAGAATTPAPGPSVVDDLANMADAYGRITGPGGQLRNGNYLPALVRQIGLLSAAQLAAQAVTPTRLSLTAGTLVPGWNVGNPLRAGWAGTRGVATPVAFTNRFGALLRGTVYTPKPGATDPYTGAPLTGPFPGVVVTPGSVQGSAGMYAWLAQDLAERGYVVLVYDVQGQGSSETLPHTTGSIFPFCNPLAPAQDTEMTGCPGVPFQQEANFVKGTEDAIDFFLSTPTAPYANPASAGAPVNAFNPVWEQFDSSPDPAAATPGRTTRLAIVGHSLGGSAVSKVQGTDERVATVVALDKLQADGAVPSVPALAVQSEYGFTVSPAALSGGDTLLPAPGQPVPGRERASGFDAWQAAGQDALLVVPRASTHLEYTDIPYVLPASRFGQALTSVYVQAWLGHQLKDEPAEALLATSFRYLEPTGKGRWAPVTLQRDALLSTRYCSAIDVGPLLDDDLTGVGC